ncbi:class I SAM-dependent methyltransferase [Roseburia faecis]|uniref:class I SAM-dependent methyltransferase n=1 Tax=Roseburia faecis TaxID=301302 RepID=UPI001897D513|nr:methyltransferase domain-containing protein [Roseburia faecis]
MGNYNFELDLKSVNTMSVINGWIQNDADVLEFGPANGRLTKYLTMQKNCKVTIVEIDREAGEEAKRYAVKSYIGKKYGNIENYYWKKNKKKYDYIIFADVLEHLSNPKKVLDNCKEILKENGRILISIPNVTHNSIIIDMLNDKFVYSDVGLLDRTHIHFFTLKTFKDMINSLEMYILNMKPIYSRVGNNEICNSYKDIPIDVQSFLRKRIEGSVYQYVFQVGLKENEKQNIILEPFGLDEYEELESQCFYKKQDQEYNDQNRISKKYRSNESVEWILNLDDIGAEYIRIDPMENNGIVDIMAYFMNKEEVIFDIKEFCTNALENYNEIMIFDNEDPWVEIKIPVEFIDAELELHVKFKILDYGRKRNEYYDLVTFLEKHGISFGTENTDINNWHLKMLNSQQQMQQQREYIKHLEKDIFKQKDYIEHLEKDISEQKKYIAHLESDVEKLKNVEK